MVDPDVFNSLPRSEQQRRLYVSRKIIQEGLGINNATIQLIVSLEGMLPKILDARTWRFLGREELRKWLRELGDSSHEEVFESLEKAYAHLKGLQDYYTERAEEVLSTGAPHYYEISEHGGQHAPGRQTPIHGTKPGPD